MYVRSSSSAIAGCGFDIVWGNGKIWSFLADSESACEQWVRTVNKAINSLPAPPGRHAGDSNLLMQTQLDNMRSPYSYNNNSNSSNNDGTNNINTNTTIPYGMASDNIMPPHTPTAPGEDSHKRGPFPGDISEIPVHHSDQSSPVNSESDSQSQTKVAVTAYPSADKEFDVQSILTANTTKKTSAAAKLGMGKKGATSKSPNSDVTATLAQQIKLLTDKVQQQQSRIDELVHQSEKEAADANASREQLVRIQQELENRTASYEKELQTAWEKDKQMMKSIREDAQRKIMDATRENLNINETATKLMADQHARELDMLHEELKAEKRRYADLLRKEVESRDRAEGKEVDLRHEIFSLSDSNNRLAAELTRVREVAKSDSINWEQEKIALLSSHDSQVQRLTGEKDRILAAAQGDLRAKISEMSEHFDATIKSIESSIKETVKKQMEAEHMREMAQLQRRCTKDIEVTRAEERRAQQAETERVRAAFMERERETADDLMELEAIHARRVSKLERQLDDCHDTASTLREQTNELTNEIKRKDKFIAKQSADHMKKMEEQAAHASSSQEQLHDAHRQIQQVKVYELNYREQVAKLLEEGRLQRAELAELRRQLSEGVAQASSFRTFVHDTETSTHATASSLSIAKQEIAMLEHELRRLKRERDGYKRSAEEKGGMLANLSTPTPYHVNAVAATPTSNRGRALRADTSSPNKSSYDILTGRKVRHSGSRQRSVSPNAVRHEHCRVRAEATPVARAASSGTKAVRGGSSRQKENASPNRAFNRSAVTSLYN